MSHATELSSRGRLARRGVWLSLVVAAVAIIVISLWPRRGAMERWMTGMRAQGEVFALEELVPLWTPLTNDIMDLIESAASQLKQLTIAGTNRPSRHWQGPRWPATNSVGWAETNLFSATGAAIEWEAFGSRAAHVRGVVRDLRAALRNPPSNTGLDYSQPNSRLNFVAKRDVAQRLFDLTLYELHNRNLTNAHENLRALIGLAQLHSEDRTLSGQMIRSAIEGLAVEATRNALSAEGWTDEQLADLQGELTRLSIFKELAAAFQMERARGLRFFETIRQDTAGPNMLGAPVGGKGSQLIDRLSISLWRRLWSEQDGLFYLQVMQRVIDCLRGLDRTHSFAEWTPELTAAYDRIERELQSPIQFRHWWSFTALPNYRRVIETAVRNETWRHLAVAAIAIERHRLRHDKPPERLSDLQPEFLSELPVDCYDGRPLRFRLNADGEFDLYSVGENFRDDGGSGSLDFIWPMPFWPAPAAK